MATARARGRATSRKAKPARKAAKPARIRKPQKTRTPLLEKQDETALRRRGVTEEQITTMLVDNPRAIFTHGGAY